jgi:hypothetical protein
VGSQDASSLFLPKRIEIIGSLTNVREYFAIGAVKYPSSETGLIAPGMSLVLTVRYAAPGLGDLDDEIEVVTEEDSFKVPVLARRTPPDLRMESPIVAAPCWLGVRSEKVVKCTNLGGTVGRR